MILPGIFFSLNAVEAFLLAVYLLSLGSSEKNSLILNLSPARFLVVVGLSLAGFWFLFLSVRSFRNSKKIKRIEEKFLGNETGLWLAFAAMFLLACLGLYLLTRDPESFGSAKLIYKRLEPLMVWLLLFGAQAASFIAVWYCGFFLVNESGRGIPETQKELLPLFGLYAALVLFKLFFITATSYGPIGSGDEMTYYTMADAFYAGVFSPREYNHYHYPPLYPLSITAALVFKGWAFDTVKFLNNLFSSGIIFPVYFIARKFFGARRSLVAAFLACLIPFHLVFPRRVVSENLYYPLFLWTMFITFAAPKSNKFRLPWDVLTGVMLAVLYLTRYITLAAIPFFLLSWWVKPFEDEKSLFKPGIRKVLHAVVVVAVMLAVFIPWPILGNRTGVAVKLMLGFGIASKTTAAQLTFSNLLIWIALYCFYFILVAAPVLNLLMIALKTFDLKNWREGFNRWIFQVLAVMGGFLMAVTRHSWRAYYNRTVPSAIMGRYLILFSVLYFGIAFVVLARFNKTDFRSRMRFILTAQILPLALVLLAYLTLIKGVIIPTDGDLLKSLGSVDAFFTELLGGWFFLLLFAIYSVTNWLMWKGLDKRAIVALTAGLVLYHAAGLPSYYQNLMDYQTYPWLASRIAKMVPFPDPYSKNSEQFTVFLPEDSNNSRDKVEIWNGLYTRGFNDTIVEPYSTDALEAMTTERGFIIRKLGADGNDDFEYPVQRFNHQEFLIIPVQK